MVALVVADVTCFWQRGSDRRDMWNGWGHHSGHYTGRSHATGQQKASTLEIRAGFSAIHIRTP
jgi:hypothetical protein